MHSQLRDFPAECEEKAFNEPTRARLHIKFITRINIIGKTHGGSGGKFNFYIFLTTSFYCSLMLLIMALMARQEGWEMEKYFAMWCAQSALLSLCSSQRAGK